MCLREGMPFLLRGLVGRGPGLPRARTTRRMAPWGLGSTWTQTRAWPWEQNQINVPSVGARNAASRSQTGGRSNLELRSRPLPVFKQQQLRALKALENSSSVELGQQAAISLRVFPLAPAPSCLSKTDLRDTYFPLCPSSRLSADEVGGTRGQQQEPSLSVSICPCA